MVRKSFSIKPKKSNNLNRSDGKETKQLIKQMADNLDQAKRSSSPNHISTDYRA